MAKFGKIADAVINTDEVLTITLEAVMSFSPETISGVHAIVVYCKNGVYKTVWRGEDKSIGQAHLDKFYTSQTGDVYEDIEESDALHDWKRE